MSKSDILKRAAGIEQQQTKAGPKRQNAPRRAKCGPGEAGAVDLDDLAAKVADALWARLERFLPICARLAAADTLHTSEKPETVLRHAIKEGEIARRMIMEVCDGI